MFDTWFSNPAQLAEPKGMEVDTVAMIKKNSTKYLWTNPETGEGSKLDVKEIYPRNKKKRGKSRYLLSVSVTVVDDGGRTIPKPVIRQQQQIQQSKDRGARQPFGLYHI